MAFPSRSSRPQEKQLKYERKRVSSGSHLCSETEAMAARATDSPRAGNPPTIPATTTRRILRGLRSGVIPSMQTPASKTTSSERTMTAVAVMREIARFRCRLSDEGVERWVMKKPKAMFTAQIKREGRQRREKAKEQWGADGKGREENEPRGRAIKLGIVLDM